MDLMRGAEVSLTLADTGVARLVIDQPTAPFNTLGAGLHRELVECLRVLHQTPGVRALVLASGKADFVVGADIGEFGALFAKDATGIAATNAPLNDGFSAFEALPMPVVAAVSGLALGGGLELALLADARVLAEGASLGLPEVKLGLIPGLGGTVRLPRLAGVETALDWITTGATQPATAALAAGLATAVVPLAELQPRAEALALALAADPALWQALRDRKLGPVNAPEPPDFPALRQSIAKRAGKHQPAALLAVDLLAETAALPRDAALAAEGRAFAEIARSQAATALVGSFFAERQLRKIAARAAEAAPRIGTVMILGAGIMGGGIAWSCARAGFSVILKDISQDSLARSEQEIARLAGRERGRGRMDPARIDQWVARIRPSLDDKGCETADLVIEAVVERLEVKRAVLAALEPRLKPGAVIATNTSSLRVAEIAEALQDPARLVGMHFFNPVPVMPLVEIIRAPATRPEAVAMAVRCALDLRKTPVIVADCPGFLVNRILTAYINAFTALVAKGVDFRAIDAAMEAWGWPMGPAHLQDVVGMDTGAKVIEVISKGYPARMPQGANVVAAMAAEGRLGQKSGAGFYRYEADATGRLQKHDNPEADAVVARLRKGPALTLADPEIVERLMVALMVEAITALQEGAVASAAELDQALLLGLGFPAYAGGALRYADWLGLPALLQSCERLAAVHGPAYAPPALLRDMAARGARFYP